MLVITSTVKIGHLFSFLYLETNEHIQARAIFLPPFQLNYFDKPIVQ